MVPKANYFVHDRALCDSAQIGVETRIWAYCHIMPGAKIGNQTNIGEHVFIENDVSIGNGCTIKNGVAIWDGVTIEDHVFVGPYVVFTNDLKPRAFLKKKKPLLLPTWIRKGATIGANATIICGITIGEFAVIGAGSVITRNVPAHALVLGNPGKIAGKVCFCGETLTSEDYCVTCELPLNLNSMNLTLKLKVAAP